ncbi:AMP-binding protein [Paenibacillus thermoaerophilus]|uniref:AMP-binding protein n=1 Tax=Paenibacillus thermoaerophilus TaxID=1215385 RepID=A0ABW2V3D6_9BACL|nr:AMP-binding protein [Paenibacillus thermoaerophilus]TMV14359.1 AMP-binding protein [Paenibacillus thermoaerophilus]
MEQAMLRALHEKAERTARAFPWYADMIRGTDIRRLNDLPPMTAEVLERRYYAAEPPAGACTVYRTSGTSGGTRKAIVYSEDDERRYVERKIELFRRLTGGLGYTRAASDMGTGHAASTAETIFRELGFETLSIPYQAPVGEHLERLRAFRPDVLYTMPSLLDALLEAAADPAALGLKRVLLVGETASPEWQSNSAKLLGIARESVIDTYGCIEIGTIAYFRHDLGRYVLLDGLIAEGLDPSEAGLPDTELSPGESILTLTSFDRELFPAIRYVTYDVVRDLRETEVDGRKTATFQALVKRVGAELKHGEKISLYDIEEVVCRHILHAAIRVGVARNRLAVGIRAAKESLTAERLEAIRLDLQEKLPEIGRMISGGLLDEIVVYADADGQPLRSGVVKHKKLYTD